MCIRANDGVYGLLHVVKYGIGVIENSTCPYEIHDTGCAPHTLDDCVVNLDVSG
jgi:hypothetical protein